jgi:hypothetical protein
MLFKKLFNIFKGVYKSLATLTKDTRAAFPIIFILRLLNVPIARPSNAIDISSPHSLNNNNNNISIKISGDNFKINNFKINKKKSKLKLIS